MKLCLICGVCGGRNPACRPEDVIEVPDPPDRHRPIRLSTRDIRLQRGREHHERRR